MKFKYTFNELLRFNRCVLSGGEAKKVNIERCLISKREVLLLDEPTISLDKDSQIRLKEKLKEEKFMRKKIIIFSTHNYFLLDIADRIISFTNKKGNNILETQPIELNTTDFQRYRKIKKE